MKHLYSKTMLDDIEETNEVHTKVENILPYLLNEKSIRNFRNNELSYFTGALIYPDKNYGVWFNRGIIKHYFGILKDLYIYKKRGIKFLKKNNLKFYDFKEDNIGNPIIYKFVNFIETGTNIYNNFLYSLIKDHLNGSKNILEIGGGFGKLASLINSNNKFNYNIIEYPGTSIICNYYLQQKFNNSDIKINFVEENLSNLNVNNNCINIFPTSVSREDVKSNIFTHIDTVLNTESFQHMNENDICFYLELFKKNRINKIISINRHYTSLDGETNFFEFFEKNGYNSVLRSNIKIDIDFFGLKNHYLSVFRSD